MTYEYRSGIDYFFGTLQTAAAISDTTISSAAFVNLPSTYSTTTYLPLVLHDPATGFDEVVWVTGHTAASASVTVVRGRQGTSARAWPSGTQVVDAPTIRDWLPLYTRATLPTDAHVGMRVPITDEGFTVERTFAGLWAPSVGVANPGDIGPLRSGATPPATATGWIRGGHVSGTTDSNGRFVVTHRTPFATATVASVCNVVSSTTPAIVGPDSETASAVTFRAFALSTGNAVGAGVAVTLQYISFGY